MDVSDWAQEFGPIAFWLLQRRSDANHHARVPYRLCTLQIRVDQHWKVQTIGSLSRRIGISHTAEWWLFDKAAHVATTIMFVGLDSHCIAWPSPKIRTFARIYVYGRLQSQNCGQ
jgi:hypothetical protein